MKLIYSASELSTNRIESVSASGEDPEYPAGNMLLENLGKVYRSVASAAPISNVVITAVLPSGVNNAIALFGVNSDTIKVEIKDVTETTTYFTETFDLTPASPARRWNRVWKEWASTGTALHLVITLTAPSTATYHEVGGIVAGETVSVPDPKYGLGQSRKSFSTVQELAGGGVYVHPGARPRVFDLSWVLDRENEFDDLDEIFEEIGERPVAILLSDSLNNPMKWAGFFHMTDTPKASHDLPAHSLVTLSLREAV